MENQEQKRIIEVNGVKMEIDLRNAKVVENYKVGDYVKVLIKEYNSYKSYIGNIIVFDNFEKTPTIVIAYLKNEYSSSTIDCSAPVVLDSINSAISPSKPVAMSFAKIAISALVGFSAHSELKSPCRYPPQPSTVNDSGVPHSSIPPVSFERNRQLPTFDFCR